MKFHKTENHIEILAPAKINWFLELKSKRPDGFHEIETVMSSVSLYDRLNFSLRRSPDSNLTISDSSPGSQPAEADVIPTDGRNLIIKAIELVRASVETSTKASNNCLNGFDIHLQKNIPSAAGLGGASSDAAAALLAANKLWNLNFSLDQLSHLAAELGSDIPFFLHGGTAICRGRGEIVDPIPTFSNVPIVIAKPACALSTAAVFKTVKLNGQPLLSKPFTELISDSELKNESTKKQPSLRNKIHFGKRMFNRLQEFAEPLTNQIGILADEFSRLNCIGHQMSGSGSSYFGVFSNARVARLAATCLSSRLPDVRIFCSHTI
jgi:4-diphosphocytidyl-2-C-methyl-D-erythritol kinase